MRLTIATTPEMRRRERGRGISGVVVLDKPVGLSSNQALQTVKRLFDARKAGHTGSLDPLASGVLPLCLGEATKFSQYLLDADKVYETTIRLGQRTDTGDCEGEVVAEAAVPTLDPERIAGQLAVLQGEIEQVPPMYSAVKRNGQPLYHLARRGITVEREARTVQIRELVVLALRQGEVSELDLRVHCSKGTYIRVLAEQVAAVLGTLAHVIALRRVQAGPFTLAQAHTLAQLQVWRAATEDPAGLDTLLLPVDVALTHVPQIELAESSGFYLRQGQAVLVPNAPTSGIVRLRLRNGDFVGIGEILDDGRVAPRRLVVTGG